MEETLDLESDAHGDPVCYPPEGDVPFDGVYLFAEIDREAEELTIFSDPYRLQAGKPWPDTAHLGAAGGVWLRVVGVGGESTDVRQ